MTRNLAYYKAGMKSLDLSGPSDFWRTIVGDLIDISVLEWCKLFGDKGSKHSFYKLTPEPDDFLFSMCNAIGISGDDFVQCQTELRRYRDKFVAHLDSDHTMYIPKMVNPHKMVVFYFNYLMGRYRDPLPSDLPSDMSVYWVKCYKEAQQIFNITSRSS